MGTIRQKCDVFPAGNVMIATMLFLLLGATGCQRIGLRGHRPSPEETELAYQQGTAALEAGHYSEAIPQLQKVVAARPTDTMVRYNLGVAYQRVHSYRESARILTAWGERGVDVRRINTQIRVPIDADGDYLYALGTSYQEMRELDKAMRCFEAAIEADPFHLKSRYSRAMLLQQRGRFKEALVAWQDYLQRDAHSAWAEGARKNLRLVQKKIGS